MPPRASIVSLPKMVAKISRKTTGSISPKKTAAGLRSVEMVE